MLKKCFIVNKIVNKIKKITSEKQKKKKVMKNSTFLMVMNPTMHSFDSRLTFKWKNFTRQRIG